METPAGFPRRRRHPPDNHPSRAISARKSLCRILMSLSGGQTLVIKSRLSSGRDSGASSAEESSWPREAAQEDRTGKRWGEMDEAPSPLGPRLRAPSPGPGVDMPAGVLVPGPGTGILPGMLCNGHPQGVPIGPSVLPLSAPVTSVFLTYHVFPETCQGLEAPGDSFTWTNRVRLEA